MLQSYKNQLETFIAATTELEKTFDFEKFHDALVLFERFNDPRGGVPRSPAYPPGEAIQGGGDAVHLLRLPAADRPEPELAGQVPATGKPVARA